MDCKYRHRLNAFHDRELSAEETDLMKRHVATCRRCSQELGELKAVARAFVDFGEEESLARVVSRGHVAAEAFRLTDDGSTIFRIAQFMTALAASLLLISSVWWIESPELPPPPRAVSVTAMPEWEKLATTFDLESNLVDSDRAVSQPAFVDAHLADWMLQNLPR